MVQSIGKAIFDGIIVLIIAFAVLAVMIVVPMVGLVYEYGSSSAMHTPFWGGITYFYTGLLAIGIFGFVAMLRQIFR